MTRMMLAIILFAFFGLVTTTTAAVVPPSNEIHQPNIPNNVTKLSRLEIDSRFTTTYKVGQSRLPATSCLMNVLNAMIELATLNFNERVSRQVYRDADYPEVTIAFITVWPRLSVQVRYLLWGVWEGIIWMMNHQTFKDLVIGARWEGTLMSNIWIRNSYEQSSIAESNGTLGLVGQSGEISVSNATIDSTRGLSVDDARNPSNKPHVTVSVTEVGETLGIAEVFGAVFAALEYMAHFPSTDEVVGFQIAPDSGSTTIGILEHPESPAAGPPFLEYQWAILAMGIIPKVFLQQRSFTEVVIEIAVDGVHLGDGFLSKERL